jgi:hypothetical protein
VIGGAYPDMDLNAKYGKLLLPAPGVIHTGRFFVLIPLKWLEKLTGVKDKYI